MPLRFIDLFAGIGGFRLALEGLGHQCVFSCEIDKHAKEAYKANFGEEPADNIVKLSVEDIPSHDVLCAGFPCQSFSISGNRKGLTDARGQLFYEIARIAEHHQPSVLLLENVRNILSIDNGEAIKEIYKTLEAIGYKVRHYALNASDFGIPQARRRVYFVCIHKNSTLKHGVITPSNERIALQDILLPKEMCEHLAIKRNDIIWRESNDGKQGNLPIRVGERLSGAQGDRVYSISGHATTQLTVSGGGARHTGLYFVPEDTRAGNKIITMGTLSHGKRQAGRILSERGHAVTQTANSHARTASGLYTISGVIRQLHITEVKRVMGFPDDHIVSKGNRGYSQLGNAVIPKMVQVAFNSIGGLH